MKIGLKAALRCRQEFFTQQVINTCQWNTIPNSLPKYLVNAKSINSCKSELENFWKRHGVQKAFEALNQFPFKSQV